MIHLMPAVREADSLQRAAARFALTGDESAAEEIVRATRPRLLAAARRIGAPQDAEDTVQAVYLAFVGCRGRPFEAPVFPWLLTTTIRIAYRRKARERRQEDLARRLAEPRAGRAPDDLAIGREEEERLRAEVDRLPEPLRDAVVLCSLQGLSAAEAARLLDVSEGAVWTRVHRARTVLRSRWPVRTTLALGSIPWLVQDLVRGAGRGAAGSGGGAAAAAVALGKGTLAGAAALLLLGIAVGTYLRGDDAREEELESARAEVEGLRRELAERRAAAPAPVPRARPERGAAETAPPTDAGSGADRAPEAPPAESASGTGGSPRPARFGFPAYDASFRGLDWEAIGGSIVGVRPHLREIVAAIGRGEEVPSALLEGLARAVAPARAGIILLQGRGMPGTGGRGVLTHPAVAANTIDAVLAAAGAPLTDPQAAAVARLAREHDAADAARRASYPSDSFALRRLIDEAEARQAFFEAVAAELRPEQRDALSPPEFRGRVGVDYYCGAVLFEERIRVVARAGADPLAAGLADLFSERLQPDETQRAALAAACADWAGTTSAASDGPDQDALTRRGFPPGPPTLDAARRTLALLEGLVARRLLDGEAAGRARAFAEVVYPILD